MPSPAALAPEVVDSKRLQHLPLVGATLQEREECLRQHQQDPGPNRGATIRAMRPDVHRVPRSARERPGGHGS
jgi:hypothetical protein